MTGMGKTIELSAVSAVVGVAASKAVRSPGMPSALDYVDVREQGRPWTAPTVGIRPAEDARETRASRDGQHHAARAPEREWSPQWERLAPMVTELHAPERSPNFCSERGQFWSRGRARGGGTPPLPSLQQETWGLGQL
jgi:hypothetical protein